jgi:hypothetical protein
MASRASHGPFGTNFVRTGLGARARPGRPLPMADNVAAVSAEGMVTVTDRPPPSRGLAVAVPRWIVAMESTMARPSPKPSWEVRSVSRWNGMLLYSDRPAEGSCSDA